MRYLVPLATNETISIYRVICVRILPIPPTYNLFRYYQETGDVSGTLSRMPHNKIRERLILKSLHRHGTDQVKAWLLLPWFEYKNERTIGSMKMWL